MSAQNQELAEQLCALSTERGGSLSAEQVEHLCGYPDSFRLVTVRASPSAAPSSEAPSPALSESASATPSAEPSKNESPSTAPSSEALCRALPPLKVIRVPSRWRTLTGRIITLNPSLLHVPPMEQRIATA